MLTDSITFQINTLEKDLQEWRRRFKLDPKDRLFINYIFISEKIKDKAKLNLIPAIQELQNIKFHYGDKYRIKDLNYHADAALNACDYIKKILKEIYEMYQKQEEYEKIRVTWQAHFPTLFLRIRHVRERIYILDRILKNEEAEKSL